MVQVNMAAGDHQVMVVVLQAHDALGRGQLVVVVDEADSGHAPLRCFFRRLYVGCA